MTAPYCKRLFGVSLLLIALSSGTSFAQLSPGGVGVFFDPEGTRSSIDVRNLPAGEHFFAYLIADVPASEFEGFWVAMQLSPAVGVTWISAGEPGLFTQWGAVGCDVPQFQMHWFGHAVPQGCIPGGRHVLGILELTLAGPGSNFADQSVCIFSASCGSTMYAPAFYKDCDGPEHSFSWWAPCAIINPTTEPPIPGALHTWGALKGQFNGRE